LVGFSNKGEGLVSAAPEKLRQKMQHLRREHGFDIISRTQKSSIQSFG
jgi:hypothetical protein